MNRPRERRSYLKCLHLFGLPLNPHTFVLLFQVLLFIIILHREAGFRDKALKCVREFGKRLPRCPDDVVMGCTAQMGDSAVSHPSYPSLWWESRCDNWCSPAALGPCLQNHRQIMNATPSWQLALLWKGRQDMFGKDIQSVTTQHPP